MKDTDYLPDSNERKEKNTEKTVCIHDFCPLKQCGEQKVQQHTGMRQGKRDGTRNPCAGVDVPRESMG